MIDTSHITNLQRLNFMIRLATDVFVDDGLMVEDWDRRFIASFRSSSRPSQWFIGGRLAATDKLWVKYGSLIKMPFPLPVATSRPALPKADADGCEYLIFGEDRRQRPCNDPATVVNSRGFRYCDVHAEQVQKSLKRRGGLMILRTYIPKR